MRKITAYPITVTYKKFNSEKDQPTIFTQHHYSLGNDLILFDNGNTQANDIVTTDYLHTQFFDAELIDITVDHTESIVLTALELAQIWGQSIQCFSVDYQLMHQIKALLS